MEPPILNYNTKYGCDFNSWFSAEKYNNIDAPDLKFENTDKNILKTFKIFLYPNEKQRSLIKSWFKIYMYVYNYTIKYIRTHPDIIKNGKLNKIALRKIIKESFPEKFKNEIKQSKIPVHTLDNAIFDTVKAFKTAFTNLKVKNIKYFRLRCKKRCDCIILEEEAFSGIENSFHVNTMGKNISSSHEFRNLKKITKI